MNIKPEGLTLPDCDCFREKATTMHEAIDRASGFTMIEAVNDMKVMNLCC